jgi:hypothetical protein
MHEKDGQGRPGAPNSQQEGPSPKEQGRRQKEKIANNSLVSPVEQKTSDKLSPTQVGEKKIESIRLLAQKLSDEFKLNITPEDIEGVSRPFKRRSSTIFDCRIVPVMFHHKKIERLIADEFFSEEEAVLSRQLPDGVFTMDEAWRLVQWIGELNACRDSKKYFIE